MSEHGFCREHREESEYPLERRTRTASELPPSEMTRAQKYETSFSPNWERVFEAQEERHGPHTDTHRRIGYARSHRKHDVPYTETQALMEAAPGAPIAKSIQEGQIERERIVDAIDRLDPRSRWIFDAIALGGKSLRTVGAELNISKTQIDRIYKAALAQLQDELKDMV
jgi:RNA polymerase sigma factor (sigma-70 family)